MKIIFVLLFLTTGCVWVNAQNNSESILDSASYSKKLNSYIPSQDSSKSIKSIFKRNKNRVVRGFESVEDTTNKAMVYSFTSQPSLSSRGLRRDGGLKPPSPLSLRTSTQVRLRPGSR